MLTPFFIPFQFLWILVKTPCILEYVFLFLIIFKFDLVVNCLFLFTFFEDALPSSFSFISTYFSKQKALVSNLHCKAHGIVAPWKERKSRQQGGKDVRELLGCIWFNFNAFKSKDFTVFTSFSVKGFLLSPKNPPRNIHHFLTVQEVIFNVMAS